LIVLKQTLTNILSIIKVPHLVVETRFGKEFSMVKDFNFILKMLVNVYNLFEPEQSRDFPTTKIEYTFPEIFGGESILLKDPTVSHVYYRKEEGSPVSAEIQSIINARLSDAEMFRQSMMMKADVLKSGCPEIIDITMTMNVGN